MGQHDTPPLPFLAGPPCSPRLPSHLVPCGADPGRMEEGETHGREKGVGKAEEDLWETQAGLASAKTLDNAGGHRATPSIAMACEFARDSMGLWGQMTVNNVVGHQTTPSISIAPKVARESTGFWSQTDPGIATQSNTFNYNGV